MARRPTREQPIQIWVGGIPEGEIWWEQRRWWWRHHQDQIAEPFPHHWDIDGVKFHIAMLRQRDPDTVRLGTADTQPGNSRSTGCRTPQTRPSTSGWTGQ